MNYINNIKCEFNYQINNFPIYNIYELANVIKQSTTIYFSGIGKSETIALHCCSLLKSIGYNCFNLNITNSLHGDIGTLNKNDLLILFSNSGNTKELKN